MHIKEIFNEKKPVISFEIFPPKKDGSLSSIYKTIDELAELEPDYISVTYGASGNIERDQTVEIASIIKNKYNIEPLAHLTCITSTKFRIDETLKKLEDNNIENILALRGDFPKDPDFEFPDPLHYEYAVDLIRHIKSNGKFCIAGAAYPEGHIESRDKHRDIYYLKDKVESGADFLITQLFFDNNYYYLFKEKTEKLGIKVPVEAGIMPVVNKKQIERIVSLCGANMPEKFLKILERYEDNKEALTDAGIAYACDQIIDLISSGVDGIHIYAMNRPDVVKKIVYNISSIVNALRIKLS